MKKNDTWLGFFKKTLKVSGVVLVILLIVLGVFIYKAATHDSYTYLSCKDDIDDEPAYFAFNQYNLKNDWDPLTEEFKRNYKIIEFNKEFIKAVFYFGKKSETEISVYENKSNSLEVVLEGYMTFNRETGKYNLSFEDRGMIGNEEDCIKIKKKDLPIKKINQKF